MLAKLIGQQITTNSKEQGRVLVSQLVGLQVFGKSFLHDVFRKVIVPRSAQKIAKESLFLVEIEFLEFIHSALFSWQE